MSMLIDLIRVAVSDKNFPQTEKDMIQKVGKSMGFTDEELDKLILYGFELMNKEEEAQAS
jgi:hypothetical protein